MDGGADLLIVEGIFSFYDARIFDALDLKIFVDCDRDERFARRMARYRSFGQSTEEQAKRYVQAVQPRQREYIEPAKWKADLIWNGLSPSTAGVDMLVNWINARAI